MMRVGMIGCGVVGGAMINYLETIKSPKTAILISKNDPGLGYDDDVRGCDIIFVSVPVPTKSFAQDNRILDEVMESLVGVKCPVVIRSTIVPGTCSYYFNRYSIDTYHMPEFLTERTANDDFIQQKNIIVGRYTRAIDSVLTTIFPYKDIQYIGTDDEACILKYAHNCLGALKVTYFNALFDLCQKKDMNFENIRKGVLMSGLFSENHTKVPGPDGQRGFGGKCFPKDLEAFIGFVGDNPVHCLLKDVHCLNRLYRDAE